MFTNDLTVKIKLKDIAIGGGAPVTVQSMLSVPSTDIEGNVRQAKALAQECYATSLNSYTSHAKWSKPSIYLSPSRHVSDGTAKTKLYATSGQCFKTVVSAR